MARESGAIPDGGGLGSESRAVEQEVACREVSADGGASRSAVPDPAGAVLMRATGPEVRFMDHRLAVRKETCLVSAASRDKWSCARGEGFPGTGREGLSAPTGAGPRLFAARRSDMSDADCPSTGARAVGESSLSAGDPGFLVVYNSRR